MSGLSIHAIRPIVSAIAIGSLPPDSASSVRASRRLICVKRSVANTAAASVDATTAPSRIASSQVRSNSTCAATPVSTAVTTTPTVLRSAAGTATRAQSPPGRLQPAFEEDQDEADDADLARELGVVELDAAGAVRAEEHAEREERDQDRHAGASRRERSEHARSEHRTDQEEHDAFVHPDILAARGRRGVARAGSRWP